MTVRVLVIELSTMIELYWGRVFPHPAVNATVVGGCQGRLSQRRSWNAMVAIATIQPLSKLQNLFCRPPSLPWTSEYQSPVYCAGTRPPSRVSAPFYGSMMNDPPTLLSFFLFHPRRNFLSLSSCPCQISNEDVILFHAENTPEFYEVKEQRNTFFPPCPPSSFFGSAAAVATNGTTPWGNNNLGRVGS